MTDDHLWSIFLEYEKLILDEWRLRKVEALFGVQLWELRLSLLFRRLALGIGPEGTLGPGRQLTP